MSTRKKVLITGANGFIGSNLCQFLFSKNYDVLACLKKQSTSFPKNCKIYEVTLPDIQLEKILSEEKPEFLVHCAGGSSVEKSIKDPHNDFIQNVVVTKSLLDAVKKHSIHTKIIFLSSAAVYGNPITMPIDEGTPTNPISPYGRNKLSAELLCQEYYDNHRIPVTILRIFSAYGPNLKKQILWDIYQKTLTDTTISLFGTGEETRDFIYIDDIAKTIEKIFFISDFSCNKYNIATGNQIKIRDLVTMMLKIMNISKPFTFSNQKKQGDPTYLTVNTEKLIGFGIAEYVPINIGIKKYIDWLLSS
jgi:UDP-glucose 4-epimerase